MNTLKIKDILLITDEHSKYLDPLVTYLNLFKFTELFDLIHKLLEFYRARAGSGDFESILSTEERVFY